MEPIPTAVNEEGWHLDPESAYYCDKCGEYKQDTDHPLCMECAGHNRGKTYARRTPLRTEGGWCVWPSDETYDHLLGMKSWVAFGVWRWHAKDAAIKGWSENSRKVQCEIARAIGCSDRQIREVQLKLAAEEPGLLLPGTFTKKVNRRTEQVKGFTVKGYERKPEAKPKRPKKLGASEDVGN